METTLLVPTDFSEPGFRDLELFVSQHKDKTFQVIFIHRIMLSSSIQDLLFFSWKKIRKEVIPEVFYQRLIEFSVAHCESVVFADVAFYHGWLQRSFEQFAERYPNPVLFIPEAFPTGFRSVMSLDLTSFVKRSFLPKIHFSTMNKETFPDSGWKFQTT